jgi:hypothetical protein
MDGRQRDVDNEEIDRRQETSGEKDDQREPMCARAAQGGHG